jgi:hypothetical protein
MSKTRKIELRIRPRSRSARSGRKRAAAPRQAAGVKERMLKFWKKLWMLDVGKIIEKKLENKK